jgi:hypothetical protein
LGKYLFDIQITYPNIFNFTCSLLKRILYFCLIICSANRVYSNDSTNLKKRKVILGTSTAGLTLGSLAYLNQAWYAQYNTGKFHFFNDNKEWLQMDKVGHGYSTYQTARLMMPAFKWAGFNRKQQLLIGGNIGLVYLTAVEVFDGYSEGWGFSWGDMGANVLGTGLAIGQQAIWDEQRLQLKFSFGKSGLAQYNPELLGESFSTQILKDYNGQTYWASVNISSFLTQSQKLSGFPKWLNVAVGYGAYGMLGGHYNDFVVQNENGYVLKFERERRFYFSLDVDLTRIKTKSKFLKSVFSVFNCVKIPAPTLQFSKSGSRGYLLYF